MIIDRIVAGIRDGAVAENLQVDPELTLEKAIQITRLSKMVKSQQPTVRAQHQEQSDTVAVDYVGSREGSLPTKNCSSNHKVLVGQTVSVADVVSPFIHSTSVLLEKQYVGNVSKRSISSTCVDPSP